MTDSAAPSAARAITARAAALIPVNKERFVRYVGVAAAFVLCVGSVHAVAQQAPQPAASATGVGLVDMVRSAIARHPDALLQQQQVAISTGSVEQALGQFDPVLSSSIERDRSNQPLLASQKNPIASTALTQTTTYGVSLQKEFSTGLTINPSLGMTRTDLNLQPPANGRGTASLTLTQPLVRGRGRDAVTANLRAARDALSSSEQNYRFTASNVAFHAATAYWNYVAASRTVSIAQEAVDRSQKMLADMQQLVAADQRPSADLKQLQADLASRQAQKLASDQQLVSARYALGMAAGLTLEEMAALPPPADDFPPPPPAEPAWTVPGLTQQALAHRADLQAAHEQAQAAAAAVISARDATRPVVNLAATFGFAGLNEGNDPGRYFRPLFDNVEGGNVTFSLNYQWPLANNVAFGQLASSEATSTQASIQEKETARTIGSQVAVAMSDVRLAMARVKITSQAVTLYRSAVQDEQTKLQLGLSTVLDLILTEDRLTQAELDQITANTAYAQAVAEIRFDTGTILTGAPTPQVSPDTLLTLP